AMSKKQRQKHENLLVGRRSLDPGISRKQNENDGGGKRPETIYESQCDKEQRASGRGRKQERGKMHRANRIHRESKRGAINPENGRWFLINPIAIRQLMMTEPPRDVCVFALRALEWNPGQRNSHRGRNQRETGDD